MSTRSRERSFAHMDINELTVHAALAKYQRDCLYDGAWHQLKEHKAGGIDEFLFVLKESTFRGSKSKALKEYGRQYDLARAELERRFPGKSAQGIYLKIAETEPNPASLFTMGEAKKQLRQERLAKMQQTDVPLHYDEKISYNTTDLKEKLSSIVDTLVAPLGVVGAALTINPLITTGAICATLALGSGYKVIESTRAYGPVAQAYTQSHVVGPHALPLKRQVAKLTKNAISDLEYSPETTVDLGEGDEMVIPESPSNPRAAASKARTAAKLVESNLDGNLLTQLEVISGSDRKKLRSVRAQSRTAFLGVAGSLPDFVESDITYSSQQNRLKDANEKVQEGVQIMEGYMDPDVVQAENNAHSVMSFWKWSTGALGSLAGLFLLNGFRNGRNRRLRRKHYGF